MSMRGTWLACGIVLLTLTGCSKGTGKPSPAKGEPQSSEPSKPDMSKAPDVTVTSDQYGKEVVDDQKAAAAEYKGKVIQLTGTVDHYQLESTGERTLFVKSKHGLLCLFLQPGAEKRPWNEAAPGQKVTVKGTFLVAVWKDFS